MCSAMADDPPPPYDAPPSYDSVILGVARPSQNLPPAGLRVVDFLPESPSIRFPLLIYRANEWLNFNPEWEAKTCETIELKCKDGMPKANCVTFLEHSTGTAYVRGLRLWLIPRRDINLGPQQINYFNATPKVLHEFLAVQFERFDSVMSELNTKLTLHPIEGRILNVETQPVKYSTSQGAVDPDRSYFTDFGFSVFVIRVFYELGPRAYETIGVVDFFPERTHTGGFFSSDVYESIPHLVSSAFSWCRREKNGFCNLQTVAMKVKEERPNRVDDMKMSIKEDRSHNHQTNYLRILRAFYVRPQSDRMSVCAPSVIQGPITCKTFLPVQLTDGAMFKPTFESTQQTLARISDWVKQHNARLISAETCAVRMYTGNEGSEGPETTYFYNRAGNGERFIFIVRLYLDGDYPNPDISMCPIAYTRWRRKPGFRTPPNSPSRVTVRQNNHEAEGEIL